MKRKKRTTFEPSSPPWREKEGHEIMDSAGNVIVTTKSGDTGYIIHWLLARPYVIEAMEQALEFVAKNRTNERLANVLRKALRRAKEITDGKTV